MGSPINKRIYLTRTTLIFPRIVLFTTNQQSVPRVRRYMKGLVHRQRMLKAKAIFTARKRSLGQGNIFAPIYNFVHRGVYLSECWDTNPPSRPPGSRPPPPWEQTSPWEQTPLLGADPPGSRHPLLGADPPPLGANPRGADPPGADTALGAEPPLHSACCEIQAIAGGMHPTGIQSCF